MTGRGVRFIAAFLVFFLLAGCFALGIALRPKAEESYRMWRAEKEVKKQAAELKKMDRAGEVLEVRPEGFRIRLESSGDGRPAGTELDVAVGPEAAVQEGMTLVKPPGETADLTRFLRPGQKVRVMEKDGKAVAVYWPRAQ